VYALAEQTAAFTLPNARYATVCNRLCWRGSRQRAVNDRWATTPLRVRAGRWAGEPLLRGRHPPVLLRLLPFCMNGCRETFSFWLDCTFTRNAHPAHLPHPAAGGMPCLPALPSFLPYPRTSRRRRFLSTAVFAARTLIKTALKCQRSGDMR